MSNTNQAQVSLGNAEDHQYHAYLTRLNTRFAARAGLAGGRLFTTNANIPISTAPFHVGLWSAYLSAIPESVRQYHNCTACRRFVERFGDLVTIDEEGRIDSPFWSPEDATGEYLPAVLALLKIIRKAKVTGVFLSSEAVWGQPETGPWRHWAFTPHRSMIFQRATQTAGQAMAERREDFKNLCVALDEFTLPVIEQALTLLRTDSLYSSEKVLGQAEFLRSLHLARDAAEIGLKANVLWRLIAAAPAGFCHPRASMIGTLLEDIAAGKDFGEVSRSFAAKMHPLQYQRPQAAPSAGAIAQAENIVAQLGAAGALRRRFAKLAEIKALWLPPTPRGAMPAKGGVFGHLTPKGETQPKAMAMDPVTMTWIKFAATVLPNAERIEIFAPNLRDSYCALVTAAVPDAPPILQWDEPDARNPVSWYVWHGGSHPAQFGLKANEWHTVDAVTLKPSMWAGEDKFQHHGQGVLFIIAGARESKQAGAAIFPQLLKAEFHGIRSVIEAYSRSAEIEGMGEDHACGLMLQKGVHWANLLRVTSGGQVVEYSLDRWD
jgi:hypothetical protein